MAADAPTFAIGDSAGTGRYQCCQCGGEITLTGPRDQLPPCEKCGTGDAVRYAPVDEQAASSRGIEPQTRRR